MDDISRRILTAIQTGFPLDRRPYATIGRTCGVTEGEAFSCIRDLYMEGDIRRIGAVFDSAALGYVSTLCALAVTDPADIEDAAQVIDSHPEVTHDYQRDDRYNLWFTVIARNPVDRQAVLDDITMRTGYTDLLDLPATHLFKIRVDFDLSDKEVAATETTSNDTFDPAFGSSRYGAGREAWPICLSDVDRVLVRLLQGDLPRSLAPFDDVVEEAGGKGCRLDVDEVIDKVRRWVDSGVIRRFGAVVRHRRLGFSHNAMGVWDIPDGQVELAGRIMASERMVSHCYARTRRPTWQPNVYSMIHGTSRESCEDCAGHIHARLREAGVDVQPARLLYSTREFKKRSMRYLCEEDRA